MRTVLLVNDVDDIRPGRTTTTLLRKFVERGHEVTVVGVDDFVLDRSDAVRASGKLAGPSPPTTNVQLVAALKASPRRRFRLDDRDLWFVRVNPARDPERVASHEVALGFCRLAAARGIPVVNSPEVLARAINKLCILDLPQEHRPETLISRDAEAIERFVRQLDGRAVLKPLKGTRGQDVFLIHPDGQTNLRQIIDVIRRQGYVMAQRYAPGASKGDVRVFLIEGRPFEVDGHVAALSRTPSAGEFRSNIAQGAKGAHTVLSDRLRARVEEMGRILGEKGYFLAGLDLIGDLVVEVNGLSPGGLTLAERFTGADFGGQVVAALERKVRRPAR